MAKRTEPPLGPRSQPSETAAPETASEALARARVHASASVAELLAALHALLDAAALGSGAAPAADHPLLGPAARLLAGLSADLDPRREASAESLLAALADALDAEIARWERRARDDEQARAVLRAFLGLRELLWELGVRPRRPDDAAPRGTRRARPRKAESARVQRVRVKG